MSEEINRKVGDLLRKNAIRRAERARSDTPPDRWGRALNKEEAEESDKEVAKDWQEVMKYQAALYAEESARLKAEDDHRKAERKRLFPAEVAAEEYREKQKQELAEKVDTVNIIGGAMILLPLVARMLGAPFWVLIISACGVGLCVSLQMLGHVKAPPGMGDRDIS